MFDCSVWLGYCSHPERSIIGVILRALYNYNTSLIQLLVGGGSIQCLAPELLVFGRV